MGNAVVSFIIGLAIILGASILNAAGLNLSKLDHMRNARSGLPEWRRPLLVLGMFLYCISQLLGSTLALEYMRAEYVAPLGSTSLIFNFLFARFLVGTQITSTDIWGTVVIIVGVCGIVAFGSWNSGISDEMDVERLTYLWRRGVWLAYFFAMSALLFILLTVSGILESLLVSRDELPVHQQPAARKPPRRSSGVLAFIFAARDKWRVFNAWLTERLEIWTSSRSDQQVAWTLGILWASTGGGLAGGTLVFAKACVKLLSGTLSHKNIGNQFGQASSIFTIILTVVTAVLQIVCLNRALRIYDSTLVVPVFYSIYTGMGWLNSLLFNAEVTSYHGYVIFLIFVCMGILIAGVVLLTHKKPDAVSAEHHSEGSTSMSGKHTARATLASREPVASGSRDGEQDVLWTLGESSDDEEDGRKTPRSPHRDTSVHSSDDDDAEHTPTGVNRDNRQGRRSGEARRLMDDAENDDDDDGFEPPPSATSLFEVPLSR